MVRVLLVEDDEQVRELVREHLARDPRFKIVGEARDGVEGVSIARRENPDIVVLDLSMPGMHGLRAAKLIRESCRNTRIVVLTSYAYEELRQRVQGDDDLSHISGLFGKNEIGRLVAYLQSLVHQS